VDVLKASLERTCRKHGVAFREEDGQALYEAVPTWGPHADVPEPLKRVAARVPLVILSNASGRPDPAQRRAAAGAFPQGVHRAAGAGLQPRMRAFEYMFDMLGCGPQDVLHVSSSYRYDLVTGYGLGIKDMLYVNRGYEPEIPFYGAHQATTIEGLAQLIGV
jgi:2-haloacid dehalogenase